MHLTEEQKVALTARLEGKLEHVQGEIVRGRLSYRILKHKHEIEIPEIKRAQARMKSGGYGICQRCKKSIPYRRLMLRPETRFCVPCQSGLETQVERSLR